MVTDVSDESAVSVLQGMKFVTMKFFCDDVGSCHNSEDHSLDITRVYMLQTSDMKSVIAETGFVIMRRLWT
jgi:hypothetical protein